MAIKFGPVGVAAGWMLVNSFYVFFYPYLLYKRILPTEKWTWYIQDIALPLLAAFAMAGLFRSFGKILGYDHIPFFLLVLATGCTFIITGISADEIRREFSGYLLRMLRKIKA
jgi:hypothetical protein